MQLGIDICEAGRFAHMESEMLKRFFTQRELEYLVQKNMALETMAGLFSAKEAFYKALGASTGITPNNILDVEVLHNQFGAPYYHFSSKLVEQHRNLSTSQIKVSISNTKTLSVAVCLILSSQTFLDKFVH